MGDPTTMIDSEGTSTFTYDLLGRQRHSSFARGITMDYGYDLTAGDWISISASTIGTLQRNFTDSGQLGGWVTAEGQTINFQYDDAGQFIGQTDSNGGNTEYVYDGLGRVTQTIDHTTGTSSSTKYDLAGRVTESTDASGSVTRYTYYPDGSPKTVTVAGKTTSYTYTPTTVTVTDPLGRQTTQVRTKEGVLDHTLNADGTTTHSSYLLSNPMVEAENYPTSYSLGDLSRSFTYLPNGQLQTASDFAGHTNTYSYTDGHLTGVTGPTGEALSYSYDSWDKLKTETFGDGGTETLDYSGAKHLLDKITLPSGKTIHFGYDSTTGQTTSRTTSTGETTGYTYTSWGAVQTMTDNTGTTSYTYDSTTHAPERIDYPSGGWIGYQYDSTGRLKQQQVAASSTGTVYTTSYTYDPTTGQLASVTDPLNGTTSYQYDAAGRRTDRTLPNGITSHWTYDAMDRITDLVHKDQNGTVLASFHYDRDPETGMPTQVTREDGTYVVYGYDAAARLESETYHAANDGITRTISYTYDAAGNRITKSDSGQTQTSHVTAGYQLDKVTNPDESTAEDYTYDADGNVTGISRDGQDLTLTYNTSGQVTSVSGDATTSYTYDGNGNRVAVTDGSTARQFINAQAGGLSSPYLVTDATGQVAAAYVYDGWAPIMRIGADGKPIYYIEDAMNSVAGLANDQGQSVASFQYDGYGNILAQSGPAADAPSSLTGDYRFQGGWRENATGLYNLRARDYDPQTGRFTSRDPQGPDQSHVESYNSYAFANGNPVVYADPTGRFSIVEINLSGAVNNLMDNWQSIATNYARQCLQGKAREMATDFIMSGLTRIVPGFKILNGVFGAFKGGLGSLRAGNIMNALVRKAISEMLCAPEWVAFEPAFEADGRPVDDGFSCQTAGNRIGDPTYIHGISGEGTFRTDILFGPYLTTTQRKDGSDMNWLGVELKLSTKTLVGDYYGADARNPGQLAALAGYTHHYTVSHAVAVFATLFAGGKGGADFKGNVLKFSEASVKNGLIAIVMSLTGQDMGFDDPE